MELERYYPKNKVIRNDFLKSSTAQCWHENLVEKFKMFVQDFITIKTGMTIF